MLSPLGDRVDCTASLPAGVPGTVTFQLGTQQPWSTSTIDSGGWAPAATLSGLASGSYSVTANYSGGGSLYADTTQTTTFQVLGTNVAATTTVYSYSITQADNATSGYAPNGNIVAYNDKVNGSWGRDSNGPLQYDNLNRLTAASWAPVSGGTQVMCWAYDSFGNRQFQYPALSCPTSGGTQYNAANRVTNNPSLAYDNAGNLTSDTNNNYLYDAEGRMCAAEVAGAQYTGGPAVIVYQYIYDASGSRVAKLLNLTPDLPPNLPSGIPSSFGCDPTLRNFTVASSYVLGQSGEQVTEMTASPGGQQSWAHTNVYAPSNGELLATYDPQGLHFQISDWLGTRRVQTDAIGQVEVQCSNNSFGDGQSCTSASGGSAGDDATEHHFTGQLHDAESGNDYFVARYLTASTGRFTSPDDGSDMDFTDPQSLNLYAYVGNNPLAYMDPTGHESECFDSSQTACSSGSVTPKTGGILSAIGNALSAVGSAIALVVTSDGTPGSPSSGTGADTETVTNHASSSSGGGQQSGTGKNISQTGGLSGTSSPLLLGAAAGSFGQGQSTGPVSKVPKTCEEQLAKINEMLDATRKGEDSQSAPKGLVQRFAQMQKGNDDFGHLIQIYNRQKQLTKAINEYKKDCGDPPNAASEYATRPITSPWPRANNSTATKNTLLVGGAIVVVVVFCPECLAVAPAY